LVLEAKMTGLSGKAGVAAGIAAYVVLIVCVIGAMTPTLAQFAA
jgi:hypothetical protein